MRAVEVLLVGTLVVGSVGCARTEYYEREQLMQPCMQFDVDASFVYIRNKTEAAREGGFGGYGADVAGGCACQ